MSRSILQLVHIDETGDSYYRMRWPAKDLAQQTGWSVVNLDARSPQRLVLALEADLLVLYQNNDLEMVPVIQARRAAGKKTIVEYNDNFYAPQPWSPVAHAWSSPVIWQAYEALMQVADLVMVTGTELRDVLSSRVPNQTFIEVPNLLPEDPLPIDRLLQAKTRPAQVGWGGSFGHLADLFSFMPAIDHVLNKFPEMHLHLMGTESIQTMVGLPSSRFSFTPWGTMQQYMTFWMPVTIGIVPLLDNDYNRCRSDIKAVEIASLGAVPVLPDYAPYRDFITATGIEAYRNREEFISILEEYLLDPAKTTAAATRCHEYVRSKRIGHTSHLRRELYTAHLPAASISRLWPYSPGYHEVPEAFVPPSSLAITFQRAQELSREGKYIEAARLLRSQWVQNPSVLDAAISEVKLLLHIGHPDLLKRIEEYGAAFPREVRFLLFRIMALRDDRGAVWDAVFSLLQEEPSAYARFYENDVFEAFRRVSREDRNILERLLPMYPNSIRLWQMGADQARIRGDREEAFRMYRKSLDLANAVGSNAQLPPAIDRAYLEMWCAALDPNV